MDEWISQSDISTQCIANTQQLSAMNCCYSNTCMNLKSMRGFSEGVDGTVLNSNYGKDYMNSTFTEIHRPIHKMGGKGNFSI